jgi:ribosomal protein S18 acetylase RimI-like enzyme
MMENRSTKQTPDEAMPVNLRPAQPEDEPFLFRVYAGTRADEMAAWGWDAAQQEAFLRMQFNAQSMAYRAQYPDADHRIIIYGNQPVGRILIDRSGQGILLIDIALLAECRNTGIGSALIRDLQREATQAGAPVRLHVLKTNPAAVRLYERLGFSITDDDGIYLEMKWLPGA